MLSEKSYLAACECLKTIAHPDRLKMIQILLKNDATVGDLAKACKIKHNMASEHLRIMKDRDLLDSTKKSREVFYKIKEKSLFNIIKCIENKFKK